MPDCFCANRLTLRCCAGLQRCSARSSPLTRREQRPRRSDPMARACAEIFCLSMPEIFCLFAPRIRARPCQGIVKLPVFSNPYRDRFGWPCVCVGCGSSPCAWGQCGPVRPHKSHCREIKGALLDPAAFSAPPRTHASCLHVCIVSACLWCACMHRTCIVCIMPACMHASFSCLHDAFLFDVHGVLCTTRHACFWTACVHRARMPAACLHARWNFFSMCRPCLGSVCRTNNLAAPCGGPWPIRGYSQEK